LPEPTSFTTTGQYIPSLKGEGKMSKSVEGSYINLTDSLEEIKEALSGAPTDSGKGTEVPTQGGVANLLILVEQFQGKQKKEEYEQTYLREGIKYMELKDSLAQAIFEVIEPIQKKRKFYEENPELVEKIIAEGATKAGKVAHETLTEAKKAMGLI